MIWYFKGRQDSRYRIHGVIGTILYLVSIASCELLSWKVEARHASPLLNREMNHPLTKSVNFFLSSLTFRASRNTENLYGNKNLFNDWR